MKMSPQFIALIAVGGIVVTGVDSGTGIATAQPNLELFVNTTCSYAQVTAALNAEAPDLAAKIAEYPIASTRLQQFLAAPTSQREQMAQQAANQLGRYQAALGGGGDQQTHAAELTQVANTCNNY